MVHASYDDISLFAGLDCCLKSLRYRDGILGYFGHVENYF